MASHLCPERDVFALEAYDAAAAQRQINFFLQGRSRSASR